MPSLRSRVAKLALETPELRGNLACVLREARENKTADINRRNLNEIVDRAAEAMGYPPGTARVTPAVIQEAAKFSRAVSKALSVWVQKYPPEDGSNVGALMDAEGAYLVFMTLDGHGVGVWDGRWSRFYKNTTKLKQFLERALSRDHQAFKNAIDEAAYETAGEKG